MAGLFLTMAGAWIAALGALVFAFHYRGGRGIARGGSLSPDLRLAWRALHLSPAQAALVVLAVVFAATAGSLIAAGPSDGSEVVRLVLAVMLAMGCGAAAALQRFRDLQGPAELAGDDTTQEIDRLRLTARAPFTAPSARTVQGQGRPQTPRFGRLAAGMGLLMAAPVAGLVISWQSDDDTAVQARLAAAAPIVASAAAAAVTPPTMPVTAASPSPTAMVAVALTDGARSAAARAPMVATPTASTGGRGAVVALPPVDRSLARRECLAQIESAHLFLGIARQSPRPSAYAVNTNPHIKRMLQSRPIAPRTLEQIAHGMWEQRNAPDRDAAWWSTQYARCEQARTAGAPYAVRG